MDLYPTIDTIGDQYQQVIPQGQPLPKLQMDYLKHNESDVSSVLRNIDFRIQLNEGGYGCVWFVKAEVNSGTTTQPVWTARELACKVMQIRFRTDWTFTDRVNAMMADMLALRYLQHENISTMVEFITLPDTKTGFPFGFVLLFMDCCDGDLWERMYQTQEKCLKEAENLDWFDQIGSALHYLHVTQLMVHLDIKPENILYKQDVQQNRVIYKLTDFGFAIAYPRHPMQSDTHTGSLRYCAPEVFSTGIIATKPLDIYSLGASMCCTIVGLDLYSRKVVRSILDTLILDGFIPGVNPPVRCRRSLIGLVRRMVDRDIWFRPTIEEVRNTQLPP